jgi:hypothetical protein
VNYEIEHFRKKEFACPCCGGVFVSEGLALWLDLLRRAWGGPVIVNSGWRCAAHNAEVGGSPRSRHLIGCAADIRIASAQRWPDFAALASRFCRLPGWEFRLYDAFIHVAVPRAEPAKLWEGGRIAL